MTVKFIDLFAGIGGFHIAFSQLGCKCVFASEINKQAQKTYRANHTIDNFVGDITTIDPYSIPNHDILCAGFPCQPFSQIGLRKGFSDTRGTLFFNILSIMKAKKPHAFFLENVRYLKKHNNGKTLRTIRNEIEAIGYNFFDYLVFAKDHGVPQSRARIFMIGFRDGQNYTPPKKRELKLTMSDILGGYCPREIGYTLRVGGRGSSISSGHNWDGYLVDGKLTRLTVKQGAKMQGFPDEFIFPVSQAQAMKQLGNSVAIPAVKDYAKSLLDALCLKNF